MSHFYELFGNVSQKKVYIYNSLQAYKSSVYGIFDLLTYAENQQSGVLDVQIVETIPQEFSAGDYFILPAMRAFADYKAFMAVIGALLIEFHKKGGILCSVCMSSFLLAETGLLDGKVATTHWKAFTEFKRLYPKVKIEKEKIISIDGSIITAGGLTSYNDLALHIIRNEYSSELANKIAHIFLLNSSRESQLPFAVYTHNANSDELVDALVDLCRSNIQRAMGTWDIAGQLHISERQLQRRCKKSTGLSIAELFRSIKLDFAADMLQRGHTVSETADTVGYADVPGFSKAFIRYKGTSPGKWKT